MINWSLLTGSSLIIGTNQEKIKDPNSVNFDSFFLHSSMKRLTWQLTHIRERRSFNRERTKFGHRTIRLTLRSKFLHQFARLSMRSIRSVASIQSRDSLAIDSFGLIQVNLNLGGDSLAKLKSLVSRRGILSIQLSNKRDDKCNAKRTSRWFPR